MYVFLRLNAFMKKERYNYLYICFFRPPPLPVLCFHGNCFADCIEVLRDHNVTKGIKFILITEGEEQVMHEMLIISTVTMVTVFILHGR
jgi:hypothetical protein